MYPQAFQQMSVGFIVADSCDGRPLDGRGEKAHGLDEEQRVPPARMLDSPALLNSYIPFPYQDHGYSIGYNPNIAIHSFQPVYHSQSKSVHFDPFEAQEKHESDNIGFHTVFGGSKQGIEDSPEPSAFQKIDRTDQLKRSMSDLEELCLHGSISPEVKRNKSLPNSPDFYPAHSLLPPLEPQIAEGPLELQEIPRQFLAPSVVTVEQKKRISKQIRDLVQTMIQVNCVCKSKIRLKSFGDWESRTCTMLQAFSEYVISKRTNNPLQVRSVASSGILSVWNDLFDSGYITPEDPMIGELENLFGPFLDDKLCVPQSFHYPKSLKKSLNRKRNKFLQAEDHLLGLGIVEFGKNVFRKDIASKIQKRFLPARDVKEIINRYKNLIARNPEMMQQFIDRIKAKEWSVAELRQLDYLFSKYGHSIHKVMGLIKAHPDDIKEQYYLWCRRRGKIRHCTKGITLSSLDSVSWTDEMDLKLLQLFQLHGSTNVNEWKELGSVLNHLSTDSIEKRLLFIIQTLSDDGKAEEGEDEWVDEYDMILIKAFLETKNVNVSEWPRESLSQLEGYDIPEIQDRLCFLIENLDE